VVSELVSALPPGLRAEVWLPTDLPHARESLCTELEARGIVVRHLNLPVLRRAYRSPVALARLAGRAAGLMLRLLVARPQVVYCTTSASLLGAPIARLTRVPRVIGHVQEVWTAADRRRLAMLASFCHQLIVASDATRAALPGRLVRRSTVVPNGVSAPAEHRPASAHTGPLRFVVASRWAPRKGHATLLAAWDQLDRPRCLTILGGPPLSGSVVDVASLVSNLREPDLVVLVGETRDIGPYLDQADVAIVPSDEPESFGLVAIEAFARGRPVVASAAGGLTEIVEPGETGWLFSPGDVDGLAAVISGLTRATVSAAGERARDRFDACFTGAAFVRRWRAALGYPV